METLAEKEHHGRAGEENADVNEIASGGGLNHRRAISRREAGGT